MQNYVIYTDTACDIRPELLKEWGVPSSSQTFKFDGSKTEYTNNDMDVKEFYDKMRAGGIAKTSAPNPAAFEKGFEEILKQGKDILYLGFSTGLSTTYNSALIAADTLLPQYPGRRILTVDTLAASAGFGLILYLTLEEQKKGATIEEAADFAKGLIMRLCHWFTVDDLVYLKRGGRVSPTVAFVGNVLGIKPVLHVDNEGHLVNVSKARGRKAAITALADKYSELAEEPGKGPIYISHGDCLADAQRLADQLKTRFGATVELITDVGPVIGAHSGPGTLALFFIGKER